MDYDLTQLPDWTSLFRKNGAHAGYKMGNAVDSVGNGYLRVKDGRRVDYYTKTGHHLPGARIRYGVLSGIPVAKEDGLSIDVDRLIEAKPELAQMIGYTKREKPAPEPVAAVFTGFDAWE